MFTFKTVESKVGKSYAKVLLHNLKKKGLVIELVKGVYTFKKSPYMFAKAIPKSYVGLGSAAFLHGLWEQVSRITILSPYASLKARVGEREISGFKVVLRKISEKMFFGYELKYMEEIGEWIRVSDPEKTLIDLVYFNYPFKKEIVPKLLEIVDNGKVMEYMRVMKLRRVRGWVKILREIKPYLN
jgi:predicted transcriptional regulator of viral defense system